MFTKSPHSIVSVCRFFDHLLIVSLAGESKSWCEQCKAVGFPLHCIAKLFLNSIFSFRCEFFVRFREKNSQFPHVRESARFAELASSNFSSRSVNYSRSRVPFFVFYKIEVIKIVSCGHSIRIKVPTINNQIPDGMLIRMQILVKVKSVKLWTYVGLSSSRLLLFRRLQHRRVSWFRMESRCSSGCSSALSNATTTAILPAHAQLWFEKPGRWRAWRRGASVSRTKCRRAKFRSLHRQFCKLKSCYCSMIHARRSYTLPILSENFSLSRNRT